MPRKITNQEFIDKICVINPNIKILSNYKGSHSYVDCLCLLDNHRWSTLATTLLSKKGCPECSANRTRMNTCQYKDRLYRINPNICVLDDYVNVSTKILHRCNVDNNVFYSTPKTLLQGHGCPVCAGNKKKTHEEYCNEIVDKFPHIHVIGKYKNNQTKILHKCEIHNYSWEVSPNWVLQSSGCPVCSGHILTHNEYIKMLNNINPNVEVLGSFKNTSTKILHRCLIDGHEWDAVPNSLLSNKGCPICGGTQKITHNDFLKRISTINDNILVIGKYKNSSEKIECKCVKCNHIWNPSPFHILNGTGCPNCKRSKGEEKCMKYFDGRNINYKREFSFDNLLSDKGNPLRFDFALLNNDNKVYYLIEYDGIQHFQKVFPNQDFELSKRYDKRKNIYCYKNNIPLLRIPYTEYENIDSLLDEVLSA